MTITSMFFSNSRSSKDATESKATKSKVTTESNDEFSCVSAESRDELNAVERFFSDATSAFSVAIDEATSIADDVHTIITAEEEESEEDEIRDVQTTEVKHEVKHEVKGKHSTLAKHIKKLGKLEQVVEKAEKQIVKANKQINAAEQEQKNTRKAIQAHSEEVLSMVEDPEESAEEEDEPNDDYEDEDLGAFDSIQRFFAPDADADEERTVVKAAPRKEKAPMQNGKLKGSHSTVTKKIKKLGKLGQVVKRAKKQIVKSEKQIKYAEEEQQKTRRIINTLSARCGLSIGTIFEEDADAGRTDDDLGELVKEGVDGLSTAGEETMNFVPRLASSVDKAVNKAIFPHE